jgi:cell division protein FtsN
LLTKSIITGVLLASLGGGTYYYGEESIRHFLEERLKISRVKKQIIPVKPKRARSGNTVKTVETSSDLEYTFFKTLTSSNNNNFPGLTKTKITKTLPPKVSKSNKIAKIQPSPQPKQVPNISIPQKTEKIKSPPIEDSLDYMVQVSSFRELAGAELMKNQLITSGYPAFLLKVDIPDKGIWYRVYLGKYAKREEAVLAAESAKAKEKLTAVVHQVS